MSPIGIIMPRRLRLLNKYRHQILQHVHALCPHFDGFVEPFLDFIGPQLQLWIPHGNPGIFNLAQGICTALWHELHAIIAILLPPSRKLSLSMFLQIGSKSSVLSMFFSTIPIL